MEDYYKVDRCLSREEIEELAITIVEELGGDPQTVGPLDELPGGLLYSGGVDYNNHLRSCIICRRKLLDEINFLLHYRRALREKNEVGLKRMLWKVDTESCTQSPTGPLRSSTTMKKIELKYTPYPGMESKQALAAATKNKRREPIRFTSEDGSILLREVPGGRDSTHYYVVIGHDNLESCKVIINNEEFTLDKSGRILSDNTLTINRDDHILIIAPARSP